MDNLNSGDQSIEAIVAKLTSKERFVFGWFGWHFQVRYDLYTGTERFHDPAYFSKITTLICGVLRSLKTNNESVLGDVYSAASALANLFDQYRDAPARESVKYDPAARYDGLLLFPQIKNPDNIFKNLQNTLSPLYSCLENQHDKIFVLGSLLAESDPDAMDYEELELGSLHPQGESTISMRKIVI